MERRAQQRHSLDYERVASRLHLLQQRFAQLRARWRTETVVKDRLSRMEFHALRGHQSPTFPCEPSPTLLAFLSLKLPLVNPTLAARVITFNTLPFALPFLPLSLLTTRTLRILLTIQLQAQLTISTERLRTRLTRSTKGHFPVSTMASLPRTRPLQLPMLTIMRRGAHLEEEATRINHNRCSNLNSLSLPSLDRLWLLPQFTLLPDSISSEFSLE